MRSSGLRDGLPQLVQRGLQFALKDREEVFLVKSDEVNFIELMLAPGEICLFHTNQLRDLLKWEDVSPETAQKIAAAVKSTSRLYQTGGVLHTILLNDRLAAWGWSHRPRDGSQIAKLHRGGQLAEVITISGGYVLPEYRHRQLGKALLSHILMETFACGAKRVYLSCGERNSTLREGIEQAGFRPASAQPHDEHGALR